MPCHPIYSLNFDINVVIDFLLFVPLDFPPLNSSINFILFSIKEKKAIHFFVAINFLLLTSLTSLPLNSSILNYLYSHQLIVDV